LTVVAPAPIIPKDAGVITKPTIVRAAIAIKLLEEFKENMPWNVDAR
jgi:hypothetical protein